MGQLNFIPIKVLSGILNAGTYIINEDLSFLPSGEYLYSLATGRFYKFGKVVLAK